MTPTDDIAALHVVPPNGGGVDRHVRDLLSRRPQDALLHVTDAQWVWEGLGRAAVVVPDEVRAWLRTRPSLVHAHSAQPSVRRAVQALCPTGAVGYVLTLHDVQFAALGGQHAPEEAQAQRAFAQLAAARIAPSRFIVGVAQSVLQPDVSVDQVANGSDCAGGSGDDLPVPSAAPCDVAVIGALGNSKGLKELDALVACLPQGIRVAVLGYTQDELLQGWRTMDRVWVHGPFEPADLPALVRALGCKLALFPGREPESHCYALSDAWCASLPALVPDVGALAERVRATGAGWIFPVTESPSALARRVVDCLDAGSSVAQAVEHAGQNMPTVAQMVAATVAVYGRVYAALPKEASAEAATNTLTSAAVPALAHLDSGFFRKELLRLGGELVREREQLAHIRSELQELARQYALRGDWIDKQQRDIDELKAALAAMPPPHQSQSLPAQSGKVGTLISRLARIGRNGR